MSGVHQLGRAAYRSCRSFRLKAAKGLTCNESCVTSDDTSSFQLKAAKGADLLLVRRAITPLRRLLGDGDGDLTLAPRSARARACARACTTTRAAKSRFEEAHLLVNAQISETQRVMSRSSL